MTLEQREKRNAYMRAFNASHKETKAARDKAYRFANKDKVEFSRKKYREEFSSERKEELKLYHAQWRSNNKERVKGYDLTRRAKGSNKDCKLRLYYGISLEEYNKLLEKQNGKCAICNLTPEVCNKGRYLCVDHNHQTGKVRGLLCNTCNRAIGLLKDNTEVLRRAAEYIDADVNAR